MKKIQSFLVLFIFLFNLQCQQTAQTVIKVEIRQNDDGWQLYRGGKPYYINGAGGTKHLDKAAASGANSVRTWSANAAIEILDDAHAKGLTVLFGLWAGCERQGFDYNDSVAVQKQLERFTEIVKTYKDHPALLMWGIGNELDLFYTNLKVWDAVNDIAKMIHELDPNHPTMTVTAGLDTAEVQLIQERAPHIDIYGINTYGGLMGIDEKIRRSGWNRPYIITEWGPDGHWEVDKTDWGVPIEQSSSEKAKIYQERYQLGISKDKEMCIGSYVFYWGQKQETTPTWYGIFLEDGSETELIDILEYEWRGKLPDNRSPQISSISLQNKKPAESVYVKSEELCALEVVVTDPDKDPLDYRWELLPESTDIKSGGDAESRPEPIEIAVKRETKDGILHFVAPKKKGAYRMFAYIYDGKGKAATANIPFYVN